VWRMGCGDGARGRRPQDGRSATVSRRSVCVRASALWHTGVHRMCTARARVPWGGGGGGAPPGGLKNADLALYKSVGFLAECVPNERPFFGGTPPWTPPGPPPPPRTPEKPPPARVPSGRPTCRQLRPGDTLWVVDDNPDATLAQHAWPGISSCRAILAGG
jgi:hypothetical protein